MTDDAEEIGRLTIERSDNRRKIAGIEDNLNRLIATVTQYLRNAQFHGIDLEILESYPNIAGELDEWRNLVNRQAQITSELKRREVE